MLPLHKISLADARSITLLQLLDILNLQLTKILLTLHTLKENHPRLQKPANRHENRMQNAVADELEVANQHDHSHQVYEYFHANEAHFASNDYYLAEIDVTHVIFGNHLIPKLIELLYQYLVLVRFQIVRVNVHH